MFIGTSADLFKLHEPTSDSRTRPGRGISFEETPSGSLEKFEYELCDSRCGRGFSNSVSRSPPAIQAYVNGHGRISAGGIASRCVY
jgi:hypothetical protein